MGRSVLGAVLLGGWLLMLPQGDLSVPVRTWKQEEAFDSARACEKARRETLSNLLRVPTPFSPAFEASNEKFRKGVEQYKNARCVPAQSVYPSANPTQVK